MLWKSMVALTLLVSSASALAGKCVCQDNFGNGKKACFDNVAQCKSFCGSMSMSYSTNSCEGGTPLPSLPVGQVRVEALATTLWTDSGVDVTDGEVFAVKVLSTVDWQTNKYWIAGGAAGHPNYRGSASYLLPGAPEGALVGRIGNGPVFLIGNDGRTPASSVGRLYLGPNDEVSGRFDNQGHLIVQIAKE